MAATTTKPAGGKLKLKSCDDRVFEVEEDVALLSETIKELLEGTGWEHEAIPLPNVSGNILAKVIEFCEFHVNSKKKVNNKPASTDEEIRSWGAEFVKVDQMLLLDIILAANYLHIKPLLNLSCSAVAEAIKGKSPEEIRSTYNMYEYEPDEEEEAQRKKVPRLDTPAAAEQGPSGEGSGAQQGAAAAPAAAPEVAPAAVPAAAPAAAPEAAPEAAPAAAQAGAAPSAAAAAATAAAASAGADAGVGVDAPKA